MASAQNEPRKYPGHLFVVEGCDGSGKSTQVRLLQHWLVSKGLSPFFTEWNSSELVSRATRRAKKTKVLTPTTFSLIHASDFADRFESQILPYLQAGFIVLADRYIYTAYARDTVRGCEPEWVKNLYRFAVKPTAVFYFRTPLDVAMGRLEASRPMIKYHESGMDLGLSPDRWESFRIFQGLLAEKYDSMIEPEGFTVMDATLPIQNLQLTLRNHVDEHLRGYQAPRLNLEEEVK